MTKFLLPLLTTFLLVGLSAGFTVAQDAAPEKKEEVPQGWQRTAGIGLDIAQLYQHNPKQGAGLNRLGFGGAATFLANYRLKRLAWDNLASWQFGVQRLGSGIIAQGNTNNKIPFQKAVDELRLNSKVGYALTPDSKFFAAADFGALSQVTPTYSNEGFAGNFLSDVFGNSTLLSKFFAPATILISAGIDYKPNTKWAIYYSPIAGKAIIVGDDLIASRGVHGNRVRGEAVNGIYADFDNADYQFGSLLRINHANKFLNDRIAFTSALTLYSNYVRNPQNIDVDWTNVLDVVIFKGLQLSIMANAFYDDDVLVQITDNNEPNGVDGLGKRVSITQQILVKYALNF